MNIAIKEPIFDVEAARKALRNAIAIRLACARDVDGIGIVIQDAELRISKMQQDFARTRVHSESGRRICQCSIAESDETLRRPRALSRPRKSTRSWQRKSRLRSLAWYR